MYRLIVLRSFGNRSIIPLCTMGIGIMGWLWDRDNKHKYSSAGFLVALKLKMKCPICLEHRFVGKMVKIDGCSHTFCYSCMKRYMDQYISLRRKLPTCPDVGCGTKLNKIHRYKKFLSLTSMANLKLLMKDVILASEQIHCPYPKCFTLMSLKEALEGENNRGDDRRHFKCTRKYRSSNVVVGDQGICIGCKGNFCVKCRVPWHSNMTCVEYRRLNPTAEVDAQFSALVSRMGWYKCPECTHTIERASGCPRMKCRCGFQFCYECGFRIDDNGRKQCCC